MRIAQIIVLACAMFGLGVIARETSPTLAGWLGLLAVICMAVALVIIAAGCARG